MRKDVFLARSPPDAFLLRERKKHLSGHSTAIMVLYFYRPLSVATNKNQTISQHFATQLLDTVFVFALGQQHIFGLNISSNVYVRQNGTPLN